MGFRLAPNSVTMDDLERCNSLNGRVISTNSVDFRAGYVKVVEDTPILFAAESRPKNLVFGDILLMAILAGNHPQRER